MMFKPINEFTSKENYLNYLFNDLGHWEMRLSYNYTKDEEKCFSKHIYYRDLIELSQQDRVKGTIDTKEEFIKKTQHRTIHPCEIIADIDDLKINNKTMFTDPLSKAKWIKKELNKLNLRPRIYQSNKGYHLHCLNYDLQIMNHEIRKEYKEKLLMKLGCDFQKASEHTTIALEGAIHWKSGLIKKEITL